jgi:hypothetical protein
MPSWQWQVLQLPKCGVLCCQFDDKQALGNSTKCKETNGFALHRPGGCRATTTTLRYCSHTYIKQASKWMEPSTCTNCVERTKARPDSNALNQVCNANYENMIGHMTLSYCYQVDDRDTSNWLQAHCQDKSTTSNHVQSKQTRNKRKISLHVYSKSAW